MKGEFIVVTNAVRERIRETVKESYNYRTGDLGLLHPLITKLFSNLERNLDDYLEAKYGISEVKSGGYWPRLILRSGESYGLYIHDKEDVPVLMFGGNLSRGCKDGLGYFLITLKEDEFIRINGTSLIKVIEGVTEVYNLNGFELSVSEKKFRSAIYYLWKGLCRFSFSNNGIIELGLEYAPRRIRDCMMY